MMKAYIEPEEIALMEQAASNLRDKILIHLLFHLGSRVSEALGLSVQDIDFNQTILTIKYLKRRLKLSCSAVGARLGAAHVFCPACKQILLTVPLNKRPVDSAANYSMMSDTMSGSLFSMTLTTLPLIIHPSIKETVK